MWLLIDEQTDRVLDIQEQPFPVAEGLLWIEDTSITDRSKAVNFTYDRQSKEFTELPTSPTRPSELSNNQIAQKLADLDAKIESTKGGREPVLGVGGGETPDPSFNPLYLLLIPVVVGAYLLGKKL